MNKSLKTALAWSALLASSAIVLGLIVYSTWTLVALVISGVLFLGAQDYRLTQSSRPLKIRSGE